MSIETEVFLPRLCDDLMKGDRLVRACYLLYHGVSVEDSRFKNRLIYRHKVLSVNLLNHLSELGLISSRLQLMTLCCIRFLRSSRCSGIVV